MGKNIFKPGIKFVSPNDMGFTEDEWNNFLIEAFRPENREQVLPPQIKFEVPVTITITPKCFTNYLDLGDENN